MNYKFSLAYRLLVSLALIELATLIHQLISTNTSDFPTPKPTMPDFKDSIDELFSCVTNAGNGGAIAREAEAAARAALITKMDRLREYCAFEAGDDREKAMRSGFPFTKTRQAQVLGTPDTPHIALTSQPGEVVMTLKKVTAAVSYMHQCSLDPELKDESWVSMNCSTSKCKLTGLIPGKVYYFRVGAVGRKEQLLYSPTISRMVA